MSRENINGGYIILARRLIESEIWRKPPAYLKIWIYILYQVNFKNTKNFPRGTGFFNFRQEQIPGVTLNQVYEFLRWAKTLNPTDLTTQITTQKTTRGVVLKVNNYNYYQDIENYIPQHRNQHKNQQTTNTITGIKEIKEDNKLSSSSLEEILNKISKEEEEELKKIAKENKIKYFRPWLRTIIDNGDIKENLEKARNRIERRKQKEILAAETKITEPQVSKEEREAGMQKVREAVAKIRKGIK